MSQNFNMIEHHITALVRAVRDGEVDSKHVMRLLRNEVAKAERDVTLQAERLKSFTKDVHLETPPAYEKSNFYWDTDRNKDPYKLSSQYLDFGSSSSEDVIKFGDYTNGDFKDWTS
jgi:hypothetical protein